MGNHRAACETSLRGPGGSIAPRQSPAREGQHAVRLAETQHARLGFQVGQQPGQVVDDDEVERTVRNERRSGVPVSTSSSAPAWPAPRRACSASASDGTAAHARPLRPTLEAMAPHRDDRLQPICSSRSPSLIPVIVTARACLPSPLRKIAMAHYREECGIRPREGGALACFNPEPRTRIPNSESRV